MARARKTPQDNTGTNDQKGNTMADNGNPRGSVSSLKMIEVPDEVLDAARGGRGHGEYDNFIDEFLAAGIRGTEVGFDGVKANSIKTGLKAAIQRAEKAEKVPEGTLAVRGKDEHVYLVRAQAAA